jgi:hypothetical protein
LEKCSFNHSIPLELYREVQLFADEIDYYALVGSAKLFTDVKFRTRKIHLKEEAATKFLEDKGFHRLILSKMTNSGRQLYIKLDSFPKRAVVFNRIALTPLRKLDLYKCDYKLLQEHRWGMYLLNKQEILVYSVDSLSVFPQLRNLQSVYIHNCVFHDLSSLARAKSVHIIGSSCSDVSCLRNVEDLKLDDCWNLVDVSPLRNIPRLLLRDCGKLTDISALTSTIISSSSSRHNHTISQR